MIYNFNLITLGILLQSFQVIDANINQFFALTIHSVPVKVTKTILYEILMICSTSKSHYLFVLLLNVTLLNVLTFDNLSILLAFYSKISLV